MRETDGSNGLAAPMDWLFAIFLFGLVYGLWDNIVTLYRAWQQDPQNFRRSMQLIAVYGVYCVVAIGFVFSRINGPQPEHIALGGTVFILAWILYGAVWLARVVPKSQPIPAWLAKTPGATDVILIAGVLAGFVSFMS